MLSLFFVLKILKTVYYRKIMFIFFNNIVIKLPKLVGNCSLLLPPLLHYY